MHCFNSNAIFLVIFDNMFENIDKQNTMDISWELISDFIFNYNLIKLTVNKKLRHLFLAVFPKRKFLYQPYLLHNSQASTNATHHCPQGPRGAQQSFILKGPTRTPNQVPFNIPSLAQKVLLLVYLLLINPFLIPNALSLKLEKSQNQNVSSTFSQHKMHLLALFQNQMTDFSTLSL